MCEVIINGETYVKKENYVVGKKYCIIRTYSAGVFAGWIDVEKIQNKSAMIYDSRRIWYWSGAASLSQLAEEGSKKQSDCKIACVVNETFLAEIIEVITFSEKAKKNIAEIKEWKV